VTLLAVPLNPFSLTDRTAATVIDGMVSMPSVFSLPGTLEERRVLIAATLSDLQNRCWTVWDGGACVGCLLLTHIVPRIDALAHFAFWDRKLFSRRALIWNLMGRVFNDLRLQRLSVEIPEHLTPLIRFTKNKLYFREEGSIAAGEHPLVTQKLSPYIANASAWAARLGSRRERAYWRSDTNEWSDLLRLRLLKSEYDMHS
jgi:hypothetical protein